MGRSGTRSAPLAQRAAHASPHLVARSQAVTVLRELLQGSTKLLAGVLTEQGAAGGVSRVLNQVRQRPVAMVAPTFASSRYWARRDSCDESASAKVGGVKGPEAHGNAQLRFCEWRALAPELGAQRATYLSCLQLGNSVRRLLKRKLHFVVCSLHVR